MTYKFTELCVISVNHFKSIIVRVIFI